MTIHERIDKFLVERRRSTGGWAEVRPEDITALHKILDMLLERKFEKDPDGDLPIEYCIVDRTRFERLSYEATPYHHEAQTTQEKQDIFATNIFNLEVAHQNLVRMHRILRDEELGTRNKKRSV
jgi:hypothetical protein